MSVGSNAMQPLVMSAVPDGSGLEAMPSRPLALHRRGAVVMDEPHRVGPNAIIQTRIALDELAGSDLRRSIFRAAGLSSLSERDPEAMVEARIVNALNAEIGRQLDTGTAHAVMRRAGLLTGDYILANRIPKPVQTLLGVLPERLAQRLLMTAIARNAWTFAGHARIETGAGFIAIHDNPICLGKIGFVSCVWHAAVFERLFRALVHPAIKIEETECAGRRGEACRFEIGRG